MEGRKAWAKSEGVREAAQTLQMTEKQYVFHFCRTNYPDLATVADASTNDFSPMGKEHYDLAYELAEYKEPEEEPSADTS